MLFTATGPAEHTHLYAVHQVEELVVGTNTGKSAQLAGYYSYWEMAVFNALVLMVLRALENLHKLLGTPGKKALFKVCSPTEQLKNVFFALQRQPA